MIQRWKSKIIEIFSQGLSKKEIFLGGLMGALIGIMPVFGLSTLVSTALSIRFKLNLGIVLFFTYAVSPIHPFMFIPFIHLGEIIVQVKHTLLTFDSIKNAFVQDYWQAIIDLWLEFVCGITGWSVVSLPIIFLIFFQTKKSSK